MIQRLRCLLRGCNYALRWTLHELPGNTRLCVLDRICTTCGRTGMATGTEAFKVRRRG